MRSWDRWSNTWGFRTHWLRRESGDFRHLSRRCPGQELGTLLSLRPFVLNSWRTAFCSMICCPCGSPPTWIRWWATCRSRARTASTWTSMSPQKTVSQLYPSPTALSVLYFFLLLLCLVNILTTGWLCRRHCANLSVKPVWSHALYGTRRIWMVRRRAGRDYYF